MARPLEQVEPLEPGTILKFKRFSAEVLHLPGHTPGLVCLWNAEHAVLFSDDHLLERVSPNPLIDLENNAEPFSGHVEIIDRLLGFYEKRQSRLRELLHVKGPQSPADLAPQIFPNAREHHLYLTLSEVMGNLEVLESQGRIARCERAGRIVFEAV